MAPRLAANLRLAQFGVLGWIGGDQTQNAILSALLSPAVCRPRQLLESATSPESHMLPHPPSLSRGCVHADVIPCSRPRCSRVTPRHSFGVATLIFKSRFPLPKPRRFQAALRLADLETNQPKRCASSLPSPVSPLMIGVAAACRFASVTNGARHQQFARRSSSRPGRGVRECNATTCRTPYSVATMVAE